jgi:RNA polymerase sigma-70 factor, ECF subfamily
MARATPGEDGGDSSRLRPAAGDGEIERGIEQELAKVMVSEDDVVSDPETVVVDPGWAALARVATGDADAFGSLVETHQERLLRLCERMLGDAEDARDAVQEVFLKAYRKAADFRPHGQVYTWLYRIATNHCLNKLRRRRLVRFVRWEEPAEQDAPPFDPPDGAADPAAALEARRQWRQTREVIGALPAGQRAVLVLARFEGLSYRQIAEILGITEGAVESRLFRAMRRVEAAQEALRSRVPRTGRGSYEA